MQKGANRYNLTEGGILSKLLLVALPVIGTQIIQMTYNLTDMFWLGRVGSAAVAASGSVGMYMWMSMAFQLLGAKGGEIGVAQSVGRGDIDSARSIGQSAFTLTALIGLIVGAVMIFFRSPLISFFNIIDPEVIAGAESYLMIVGIGVPFSFMTAAMTAVFNGRGNAIIPFLINSVGLAINMVLDPILILNYGLGIQGAAYATITAQIVACGLMMIMLLKSKHRPIDGFQLFRRPKPHHIKRILRWTTPIAIESFLFTGLSMIISRLVAGFGTDAMATSRIGSQVESLSWLIAGGFSTALTAFVGQNFGAGKWDRIHKGVAISSWAMVVYGAFITMILFFGASGIFAIFLPGEENVIAMGEVYLKILASCQLIACLEAVASGAFRGIGKTMQPSIASVVSNVLRVIAAVILSTKTPLGLIGIWWSIALGAALRGLWMYIWYQKTARTQRKLMANASL